MHPYTDQLTSRPRGVFSLFNVRRKPQPGQSLVEFSLMAIVLVILLMGVMDLGRAYFTYLALKDAAAEGAYYGQGHPAWIDGSLSGASDDDPNNIIYRVKNSAPKGGLVDWDGATVTVEVVAPPTPGQTLTVTVTAPYQLITPFVGGQLLTLKARAVSVIVSPP
jgi:Flp pilus assembly protein TadG